MTSTTALPMLCTPGIALVWSDTDGLQHPIAASCLRPTLPRGDEDHLPLCRRGRAAVSATRSHERRIHLRSEHQRVGAPAGSIGQQQPGVAVELLKRRDPGVNRRQLGRGHEARQAEVRPGDHGREHRDDDRAAPLDGLDLVDHVTVSDMVPCHQEAIAITMEPLPLSPRGGAGAVMPYAT